MPMLDWIRDYLDGLGIESQLAPGADETKANLYATIGGNEAAGGGVALSGHTDVVPVAGQGRGTEQDDGDSGGAHTATADRGWSPTTDDGLDG